MIAISIPFLYSANTQIAAGTSGQVGPEHRRSRFFQKETSPARSIGACLLSAQCSTSNRARFQQPIHATGGGVDRYACLLHAGEDEPAFRVRTERPTTLVP